MSTKRNMPAARADRPAVNMQWEVPAATMERWSPNLAATDAGTGSQDATISIYDPIGYDPWSGGGVTANRIAAALRSIGASNDVVVNMNSPGGDMFEGLAIYNLLRQHKGQVTVRVLGLAASAASVIACAGDVVQIARAGFLMIHNCWMGCVGDRNDMIEMAATLEPFDMAMADIYATRSGQDVTKKIMPMMNAETWIGGQSAVDQGFADELLPADQVTQSARTDGKVAAYLLDLALAKAGMPRTERRAMMQEYKAGTRSAAGAGKPGAARVDPAAPSGAAGIDNTTPRAGADVLAALQSFSFEARLLSFNATV